MNNENKNKRYKVTFIEKKKYNPMTRTVEVEARDEFTASLVVSSRFDTYSFNKEIHTYLPSGKKIDITKIEEIKEKEEEKVSD